jgi:ribosomal protein L7/L12
MGITISMKEFRKLIISDEGKQRRITELAGDNAYLQGLLDDKERTIDSLYERLSNAQKETEKVKANLPPPVMEAISPKFDSDQSQLIMNYFCRLPAQTFRDILEQMYPGQKIYQIKFVRSLGGISLKDAKDFIEGAIDNFGFTKAFW